MTAEPSAQRFIARSQARRATSLMLPVWIALPIYLASALLVPTFQAPDEPQHLFRAWQLSQGQIIGERRGNEAGGTLPGGLGLAVELELGTVAPHVAERFVPPPRPSLWPRSTEIDARPPQFENFPGSVLYSPASYAPQLAAVWLGRAAGWSVETIVTVGRIVNSLFFLGLIGLSLRVTPWARPAFAFVVLLPTTAGAVTNFGQDGFVLGISALAVAVGLRVSLAGDWKGSDTRLALIAAAGLALTKWVYLPLFLVAGLALHARSRKFDHYLRLSAILFGSLLLSAVWLVLANSIRVVPAVDVAPIGMRLSSFVADPGNFIQALGATFFGPHGLVIIDGAFSFGWLNVGPVLIAFPLTMAALVAMLLHGDQAPKAPGLPDRIWLLLLGVGTTILVSFALWLYYTPDVMTSIRGIQARYLLPPALALLPALIPNRCRWERGAFWMLALLVVANLVCLQEIARTYYAF